jgi:hypothetical protein
MSPFKILRNAALVAAACLGRANAAPPILKSTSVVSNVVAFSVQTTAGAVVEQRSIDLKSWGDIEVFSATNGTAVFFENTEGFANVFYRVREASPAETPNPVAPLAVTASTFATSGLATVDTNNVFDLRDANGVDYQLILPPGAVAGYAPVTITALSSIGALPISGPVIGAVLVDFPDLPLFEPATLTITAPSPLATNTVAFSANPDGSGFFLTPFNTTGSAIELSLTQDGVFGAGSATVAEFDLTSPN